MVKRGFFLFLIMAVVLISGVPPVYPINQAGDYDQLPPFLTSGVPPLVMLVMGRDHKLYYEAYNDASDLNEDGKLDIRYDPDIEYYGYFDCYKCYIYSGGRFEPLLVTPDKKCNKVGGGHSPSKGEWSGNYLNYLTTSRMDAVRKVLYGGKRSYDGTETASSSVILERVFIPQDAHTWGKEYAEAVSAVSMAAVAPFPEPLTGRRHMFASTTLSANGDPVLRVALNTDPGKRIWDWVSKERPVADNSIASTAGGIAYNSHPANHDEYDDMIFQYAKTRYEQNVSGETFYATSNGVLSGRIAGNGNPWGDDYPHDPLPFFPPAGTYDKDAHDQQNYLTIFDGNIRVDTSDYYEFAVDGDDAIEFIVSGVTDVVSGNEVVPGLTVVAAWYAGHGRCDGDGAEPLDAACTSGIPPYTSGAAKFRGKIYLTAGVDYDIEFRHQENTGDDNYYLYWKGAESAASPWGIVPTTVFDESGATLTQTTYDLVAPSGTPVNYNVRVKVCDPRSDANGNSLLEANCKAYSDGTHTYYKPVGLLQTHGESEKMYFGLMSGSNMHNTRGGVLRKNISSFTDEVNSQTGQFTSVKGIVHTINTFRTVGFAYSGIYQYNQNCGLINDGPIDDGECRMWGNPIAEIMYETLRYFAGEETPTSDFVTGISNGNDDTLDLPLANWIDPYDLDSGGFDYCAKPFMLVISDIYPSYDSDQLPGVHTEFDAGFAGTLSSAEDSPVALNVETLADRIFEIEGASFATPYFIGQVGTDYDGSCSPKTVDGLGDVRGLCPEEPTKGGSYYSASVAYFGRKQDISGATDVQNVNTYAVALASPLPRIEIEVGSGDDLKTITMVPFAKTVGNLPNTILPTMGGFQPTNALADFYVESITPTSGVFRINYEDREQGSDYDMDAIVKYSYEVGTDPTSGVSRVRIEVRSVSAVGGAFQHMGYIISGTTRDGTYLETRDHDTNAAQDHDYFLDTPHHTVDVGPYVSGSTGWQDSEIGLPNNTHPPQPTVRYFWPGDTPAATLLNDPLWYAAKYGGFTESSGTTEIAPDQGREWDEDENGVPDSYFLVVNPLKLEEQLSKSFLAILARVSSGTAASVISNSRSGEGAIYQSIFYAEYLGEVTWVGEVHAFLVDAYGNMRVDTNNNDQLDLSTDLIVVFNAEGLIELWQDVDADGQLEKSTGGGPDTRVPGIFDLTDPEINYLWTSSEWLNEINDVDVMLQRTYGAAEDKRYIFTFVDQDGNMVAAATEQQDFVSAVLEDIDLTDDTRIYPYIQPYAPFNKPDYVLAFDDDAEAFEDYLKRQTRRVINYVRGADQDEETSADHNYTIPAFRSRQIDYDDDGNVETWRLGDVVHSTPTVIGRPAENYDLLYHDLSYSDFYNAYEKRRSVVYCGANDGMFHAFNAGFYNPVTKAFLRQPVDGDGNTITSYTIGASTINIAAHDLGAELWAYVPFNLLPHLHWLTDPNYPHIYYTDLKPKIFDAKIFQAGVDPVTGINHPNGWGTILVSGMRLGGGKIQADMDKTDGDLFIDGTDRIMTSAFFVLDITNPESPPAVLAEFAFNDLGFTTSYPTVIPMRNRVIAADGAITFDNPGGWYLVIGSGPANADGDADTVALDGASSAQTAKLYIVDLVKLGTNHQLWTLDDTGTSQNGIQAFAALDANSFISDIISVDYDLNYNTDAIYFGTVSGDETVGWGGKLRRVRLLDNTDTANWAAGKDSTMIDLSPNPLGLSNGQPITAAPSIALDTAGDRWVFFGTGRFFNREDAENSDQQSFYGIKEPAADLTGTVVRNHLLDVSNVVVYEDGSHVDLAGTNTNWDGLLDEIEDHQGWYLDFQDAKERNLGQATLLGDILTFTTYMPSLDPCTFEGYTSLYATFYKTGTAFTESVIGLGSRVSAETGKQEVLRKTSLGRGLSITPNIHTGRETGSKVFVQTSTGAIEVVQEENPGMTKSGRLSWEEDY